MDWNDSGSRLAEFVKEASAQKKEESPKSTALTVSKAGLDQEAVDILNQLVEEKSPERSKDLTYKFSENQNKKTTLRLNKLNEILDKLTDQAMERIIRRPDEMSNQELLQAIKVIRDVADKDQKQILGGTELPSQFIQINQQNNDISLGEAGEGLSRESKDRVKNAVSQIFAALSGQDEPSEDVVGAEISEET